MAKPMASRLASLRFRPALACGCSRPRSRRVGGGSSWLASLSSSDSSCRLRSLAGPRLAPLLIVDAASSGGCRGGPRLIFAVDRNRNLGPSTSALAIRAKNERLPGPGRRVAAQHHLRLWVHARQGEPIGPQARTPRNGFAGGGAALTASGRVCGGSRWGGAGRRAQFGRVRFQASNRTAEVEAPSAAPAPAAGDDTEELLIGWKGETYQPKNVKVTCGLGGPLPPVAAHPRAPLPQALRLLRGAWAMAATVRAALCSCAHLHATPHPRTEHDGKRQPLPGGALVGGACSGGWGAAGVWGGVVRAGRCSVHPTRTD
jgi:hypothetical protein